jgi:hypothetical protein
MPGRGIVRASGRLHYSALLTNLASPFGTRLRQWRQHHGLSQLSLAPSCRVGDQNICTIAMVARFNHPADTSLDVLNVELMCPMDEAAERFFRAAAGWTARPGPVTHAGLTHGLCPARL